MVKKFNAIESFCGVGGLGLGLHRAGFNIRAAFDINELAVQTYRENLSDHVFVADATQMTGTKLLSQAGLEEGELDLFAGGPPCQGFSKQKKGAHLGDDDRNRLVLDFARLVRETLPRFFFLENVAMFGQKRGKAFVEAIREQLQDYTLYPHFYNSADYGLAQTRERFVVIGKYKKVKAPFRVPTPTVTKWKTVRDALAGLPEPPLDPRKEHPDYPNHQRASVTAINIKRFSFVPQGGGWQDIPEELRLDCHKNVDTTKGGWPDVFGRLRWDGQAPTITDSFTRGRYGHPLQDRPLTPREAALLQGFPRSYRFIGTRHAVRHQIGNAVPPPLAEAIGDEIVRSLMMEDGLIPFGEDDADRGQIKLNFAALPAAGD